MKDDSPEIERIKTAAEIELAGLQAREAAVKDLVGKGRKRSELADALSKVRLKVRIEQQNAEQEEKAVAFYEDQLKHYQPFPVVDNKVTIRPIKWEVTKATK